MEETISVKNLDHLGLIAGLIDELSIVSVIDELIPTDRKVSIGLMVKALILNSMGFSHHATRVPETFIG